MDRLKKGWKIFKPQMVVPLKFCRGCQNYINNDRNKVFQDLDRMACVFRMCMKCFDGKYSENLKTIFKKIVNNRTLIIC